MDVILLYVMQTVLSITRLYYVALQVESAQKVKEEEELCCLLIADRTGEISLPGGERK